VSIQEERELRERLGGLLDEVKPRQAPVIAAVRQGRGIRLRRRIGVGAGLAVLACGAALTPAVLHAVSSAPPPEAPGIPHYSVTVNHLPGQARHGVIGSGTEDGHRWQVSLSGRGTNLTAIGTGVTLLGIGPGAGRGDQPVFDGGFGGSSVGQMALGVSPAVTDVRIILVGGKVLDLTPVRYGGYSWVGLELPAHVHPVRAEAFAGSRELSYSIPAPLGFGLDNWWLPGQEGPARFTRLIGSGTIDGQSWSETARIGPWGYCYQGSTGEVCEDGLHPSPSISRGALSELTCGPIGDAGDAGPSGGIAAVGLDAREVELHLSGGGTERFPVVNVAGTQMFAFVYPKRQQVTGMTAFGARGQIVATATGSSLTC
jgi:hypothetical protein